MRKREIYRKLDEIIDFSGVERYIDTPVKRYSSGMYVRLAFAVAAHLESEILIVDEVLAVGDAEFQKKCLGKMGEVSKGEGRTVLFVSHNMAAVRSLCGKGIVLKDGTLNYTGNAFEAVSAYQKTAVSNGVVNSTWDEENAPGDYRAKILSATAKPTNGEVLNFGSGITLTFIIKTMIDKSLLDLSFDLKNQEEVLLFHHGNYISDSASLAKGMYQMEIKILPFLLNEGNYHVNAWLGLGATEMLGNIRENVISFSVESSNIDHIVKPLPGILRPLLGYNTTLVHGS
jgi:lipopolysaccharide transport system ATP-binding protein